MDKAPKKYIVIYLIITSLYWFAQYAYVSILSTYASELGASFVMIGLITGAYGLMQLICRLPLGIMSDRMGLRKPFVIAGVAFIFLSAAIVCAAQSPEMLLISRVLAGISASSWVPMTVLFTSYFGSGNVSKAIGWIMTANFAGQFAANLSGGLVADSFGNVYAFAVSAAAAAPALVLGIFIYEKRAPYKGSKLKVADFLVTIKVRAVFLASLLAIFNQYINFAVSITFVPLLAQSQLGASPFDLGLMAALRMGASMLAAFTNGRIEKKLSDRARHTASFAGSALICAATPFAGSVAALIVLQIVLGYVTSVSMTGLMSMAANGVPQEKRATAMGFYQAIYALGMVVGPVVTGWIRGGSKDYIPAFMISGAVALAAMGVAALFVRGKKAAREKSA